MTDTGETRADYLMRTSEIYRRLWSDPVTTAREPGPDLPRDLAAPDTARALPPDPDLALPPPGPPFWRRMLTRRLDIREVVLLVLVLIALIVNAR